VTDLAATASAMSLPLAGILGMDFLRRFVLRLDYRAGRVNLGEAVPAAAPPDAAPLRLRALPYVVARVTRGGRTAQGEFQLDAGSNTAIEFWAPFAQQAFPDARGAPGEDMGVGGADRTLRGRVDRLELAGLRTSALTVNFADETRPADAGDGYAGVIGGPAWAGQAVTMDFPGRRLWVT
jgi:hypothetical protein